MAAWGTDVPEDLELNDEALANALKKVKGRSNFSQVNTFFLCVADISNTQMTMCTGG